MTFRLITSISIAATMIAFSTPAWATTFEERIEMPTWGDLTFVCETNPRWTVAYYYHPTTGKKVLKYWEATVVNFNPYQEEYTELDQTTFRKRCGMSKYETGFLRGQALQAQTNSTARPVIAGTRNVRLTPNPD